MKKRIPSLALALGLCIACALPAWVQTPGAGIQRNNRIEVLVKTRSGEVVKNLIWLELFRGNIPLEERYADSRGRYLFAGLEDGDYTVRVTAPGYNTEQQEARLNANIPRTMVFLLTRKSTDEMRIVLAEEDATVDLRWLAASERAREEITKAREQRYRQDFKSAIKHAERALKADPNFVLAHNELGLCFQGQEELDKARKAFEIAIELDPDFLPPYLNLAEVWAQKKEHNRAGQLLMQASKVHPERGEPYFAMAKIQLDAGHPDRAEQACSLALQHDHSQIPGVHLLLANIYMRRGDKARVVAALAAYLEQAPEGEQAETARATLQTVKAELAEDSGAPSDP